MHALLVIVSLALARPAISQQIWDFWQTTWDRSKLFTSLAPSTPINFVTPGPTGSANIVVSDSTLFQSIVGFGGSLTDSAALTLNNLKAKNAANYWSLIGYMFTITDGANAAGLNYIRVPIGASDFSASGVSFHCYAGSVGQQDSFHSAFPSKEIYFTECTGIFGSDWWTDMKWYTDNLWIGSLEHNAMAVRLLINPLYIRSLALDGNGLPTLPGTNSCSSGCRPLVTVNSDGSFSYNQEFYSMAQASKAIIPKDAGGPFGQRIGVSVGGSLSWALRVGAYVTGRVPSSDWSRYSLVVMNWDDSASTTWNPVPVTATIAFRGMQSTYTFPVGVTTLWWFAPGTASAAVNFSNNGTFTASNMTMTQKASPASTHGSTHINVTVSVTSIPQTTFVHSASLVSSSGVPTHNATFNFNGTTPLTAAINTATTSI